MCYLSLKRSGLNYDYFSFKKPTPSTAQRRKHLLLSRRVSDYSTHTQPPQLKAVLLSGEKDGRRKIKVKNQCVGIH
jgi:hypothetical protein